MFLCITWEGKTIMENLIPLINKDQIISVINKMLLYVDPRLVYHGERVAYIVLEMLKHVEIPLSLDADKLIILSLLHDIGAYKTEEIDEMVSFESEAVWSHSIYGYLFLKYMSPIGDESEAILYHHLNYCDYDKADCKYLDYAALINLADRVDILCATSHGKCDFSLITDNSGIRFHPEYVKLLFNSDLDQIIKTLQDGSYEEKLMERINQLSFSTKEAFEYLKMMVFSVDFRSEYTVTHTINTTAISIELGKRLKLSTEDIQKIYLGALLHDVGKVAIDPAILEFPGRLTPQQMDIMKKHVIYTREIIEDVVDDEIVKIASRHHEKLDGSGYPDSLRSAYLTIPQQIIAVADIVSALTSKRSYKDAFPKERTLKILNEMLDNGQLSPLICHEMINHFDEIMLITDGSQNPIIIVYELMHEEYLRLNNKIQKLLD